MGQTTSSTSRHDNASTRTLHSASVHSNRPFSFVRRIQHKLHKSRRFRRHRARNATTTTTTTTNAVTDTAPVTAASTSSSVRHETQEAAARAAVATGPLYHLQSQSSSSSDNNGSTANPNITIEEEHQENDEPTSIISLFQLPNFSNTQENNSQDNESTEPGGGGLSALLSLILLSYFGGLTNDTTSFITIQRPSSEHSIASSNTIDQSNDTSQQRSVIFIVHGPGLSENPSYEELLMLGTMLGQVRPDTTTQAAVDEAVPVTLWSETIQKDLTEKCLVCLDEFINAQAVRILKCRHVFHRECVDRWLCESHNSCPVCRRVPVE